jgi:hypothetical protein
VTDTAITGVGFALPGDLTGFSLVNDSAGFTFFENVTNGFGRLDRPTSMALDERGRTLYITELLTGRVVAMAIAR